MDFDAIFDEIATLSRIIHELPSGATERRLELQARLEGLKVAARTASRSHPHTRSALRRDIERLESMIKSIDDRKINVAANSGGSPGGDFGFTKDAMDINNAIDRGAGRSALVAKLQDARAKLEALGDSIEER